MPKLLMAQEMTICDHQTMPAAHYCVPLLSPVLDRHALPKAFWDPNFKAFWVSGTKGDQLIISISWLKSIFRR